MRIRMVGIDHQNADIATREAFSFTPEEAQSFLRGCLADPQVQEAVLLTTCSRTELWTVGEASPWSLLLRNREGSLPGIAIRREGGQAVQHLHRLACGLCSPVSGDEQIAAQVRTAAELAKDTCGPVLSQLFRSAVTAGKQARTQVGVLRLPHSVAAQAVEKADELLGGLRGKHALIVGSGAMGSLAASHLLQRGAQVYMTRRQYHKATQAYVPPGVERIDYDNRYAVIGQCDLAIGATSSPHHVLRAEPLSRAIDRPLLLVDIALPRDIEPEVTSIPGVTLVDLDHIGSPALDAGALNAMEQIAGSHAAGFLEWLDLRETLPSIEALRGYARERMASLEGLTCEQRRDVETQALAMLDTLLFTVKKREGLAAFKTVSGALGRAAIREEKHT